MIILFVLLQLWPVTERTVPSRLVRDFFEKCLDVSFGQDEKIPKHAVDACDESERTLRKAAGID